ncbi:hypothetical protein ABT215_07710 [Streptomyces sp900105755]|uniref:hypothetical protein n=1 Tax=Streptomyces sp. 900105755 TaxID=3154389 RepID=UPI0033199007
MFTLVVHRDDDQIVTKVAAGDNSSKPLKDCMYKVYPGGPRGLAMVPSSPRSSTRKTTQAFPDNTGTEAEGGCPVLRGRALHPSQGGSGWQRWPERLKA